VEALRVLGEWERPSGRDRLMGLWRPVPGRDRAEASKALSGRLTVLLEASPAPVVVEAARLAGAFKLEGAAAILKNSFERREAPGPARAAALRAIAELGDPIIMTLVPPAFSDRDEAVAREAVALIRHSGIHAPESLLVEFAKKGRWLSVRQTAVSMLGSEGLGRLLDAGVPPDLQLDLLEAAAKQPELKEKAAKVQASLAPYAETLSGGDAEAGRRIFFERSDVQCLRCHQVGDQGGQVGPPLTKLAEQKTREYLLESIVAPNKQIAEGWGQVALQLQNDAVEVGRVEKETDAAITLVLADGQRKVIAKGDLKARKAALSAMPEDLVKNLSRRDLRDLIEFLAGLK